MHPAPSVIIFTVLSGIGFAMLALLGIGQPEVNGFEAIPYYFVGITLAVIGLLASVFHLKNPKNAIKAFSQFRSSWLSREGVFAVISLVQSTFVLAIKVVFGFHPLLSGGVSLIICSFTIFTTAMIYTQLKTVPRWNQWLTPFVFFLSSYTGAAIILGQVLLGFLLLLMLTVVQIAYWIIGDRAFSKRGHTIETATGLGRLGKAREFEPPHTGQNYLLNEMVYVVGRKHSIKLRTIGMLFLVGLPLPILWFFNVSFAMVVSVFCLHLVGLFICRWLFFAEAEHVVGLYYDKR
ncbi:MAG: DmsC/YnfH family molybdoenzyme membrane anchor subunit [Pseudomonadota bacterium]